MNTSQNSKGWFIKKYNMSIIALMYLLCDYQAKTIPSGLKCSYLTLCVLYLCNNLLCSSIMWHMFQENKTIKQLRHISQECVMLFHFIASTSWFFSRSLWHQYFSNVCVWLLLSRYVDGGSLAEQQAALLHYQQDNLQYLSKEVCSSLPFTQVWTNDSHISTRDYVPGVWWSEILCFCSHKVSLASYLVAYLWDGADI